MTATTTEPIDQDWTAIDPTTDEAIGEASRPEQLTHATATEVNRQLARLAVHDIDAPLQPFMAAAGAEMALGAGIGWPFSTDDAPVALLRLIARVGILTPQVGGPHTDRLRDQLRSRLNAQL